MVLSMTGYGRAEMTLNDRVITVELRSVNNRYLDCNVKMPRTYLMVEDSLKKLVKGEISRGKVDVFISVDATKSNQDTVTMNDAIVSSYLKAFSALSDKYAIQNDVTMSVIARLPDVFSIKTEETNNDTIAEDFGQVMNAALAEFHEMRKIEGEKLKADILSRAETIEKMLAFVEERSGETLQQYRERLTLKMQEVLSDANIDDSRIVAEAAIYADKIAIDEETVRLHSHIAQLRDMLAAGGPIGRKLDFLIQEFNRETNTIGSKCNNLEVTQTVVDMKSEIEKIREQVQNIE